MQRLFDIVFSGLALLLFAPFLIPVAVFLKLTGEGEIFFSQNRIGRNGEIFKLLKFATMLKDSPNIGNGTVTLHNDPRILPMGHLLRNTKINELPQLLNIFLGDMSIIGPRPQAKRSFDAYSESAKKSIIKARPGLSGVGSIAFRNEEAMIHANNSPDIFYDNIVMPFKGSLEEWYVSNQSLKVYFAMIFLTVVVVIKPSSKLMWNLFEDIPRPPKELREWV
jgi:lipopolysaccharide/colanic/teichoic acid biosynthesis glycosyltransferase